MANLVENSLLIEKRPYKDYDYKLAPISTKANCGNPRSTPDTEKSRINSPLLRADVKKSKNTMDQSTGSTKFQFIAAIAANLCVLAGGAMLGWTSPVLLGLEQVPKTSDNPLETPLTKDESSWVGSLTPVGTLIGSFLAGYMAERFGRRVTLLSCVVPFTIGWILIAAATSVGLLYAGRFIAGVGLAFPFTVVPMYCGEIADTSIRGILGSFLQLFITIGLLYAYCIGPYVSYTIFWIACAVVPLAFFAAFFPMPESPYFLAVKGRHEEVVSALVRLRSKSAKEVLAEAEDIRASVEESYRHQSSVMDLFTVKANFKALLLTCALVTFQQMTGINVVLFYSQSIFDSAGDTGISASVATIIIGIVQLAASCVTPVVVDRLGRKILLIASGIGTSISLAALGAFFYLKYAAESDVSGISWLPIASLVVFMIAYCVGWGPLPWTVMGEMFAPEVKSKASGITVCVCWTLAFLITKYFSAIAALAGQYTAFWLFGVFCVISVFFTVFILPETKGKSLQEIQFELGGGPVDSNR